MHLNYLEGRTETDFISFWVFLCAFQTAKVQTAFFPLTHPAFVFQSCGTTACTRGRTRRKTRSAPSRRRSPSLSLISFFFLPPRPCATLPICYPPPATDAHLTPASPRIFILTALPRPYIVYMLQDLDILEDWTAIRKVFFF